MFCWFFTSCPDSIKAVKQQVRSVSHKEELTSNINHVWITLWMVVDITWTSAIAWQLPGLNSRKIEAQTIEHESTHIQVLPCLLPLNALGDVWQANIPVAHPSTRAVGVVTPRHRVEGRCCAARLVGAGMRWWGIWAAGFTHPSFSLWAVCW